MDIKTSNLVLSVLIWSLFGLINSGCEEVLSGGAAGRVDKDNGGGEGSDTSDYEITEQGIDPSKVSSKDNAIGANCTTVKFNVKKLGNLEEGHKVKFKISNLTEATTEAELLILAEADIGSITPKEADTDAEGNVSTQYCGGDGDIDVAIIATIDSVSANSATIKVLGAAVYTFTYSHSDLPPTRVKENGDVLELNLFDSGSNDCTKIYFNLAKNGAAVGETKIRFKTQTDFPKGTKLALKDDSGAVDDDPKTGREYSYADITSNADSLFAVPICAGIELGTILIKGVYTDSKKVETEVISPVIVITTGLASWLNMSVTFDSTNARTLDAYFNTNSPVQHPFLITLGTSQNGDPLETEPIQIVSESGKLDVYNGGLPSDGGSVLFTFQALHAAGNRPYAVHPYSMPAGQIRCDPEALSNDVTAVDIPYKEVKENWRSTVAYVTKGQEAYFDVNRNGLYDEGGDGFWDKNQNGIFDGSDVITYDDNTNGLVDGEYFIDLPSPFVDVDEDGDYTAGVDILIGDAYSAPNGKRDNETLIWKDIAIPYFFGTSPYSIKHAQVNTVATGFMIEDSHDWVWNFADSYYQDLDNRGYNLLSSEPFAYNTPTWNSPLLLKQRFYFFMHGVCGNPIKGGSEISIAIQDVASAPYGNRDIIAQIFIQPGDNIREPSRQLLADADGGSSAVANFNIADHPSSEFGYPVQFQITQPACTKACTGAIAGAGVACGGKDFIVYLTVDTVTVDQTYTLDPVSTCACSGITTLVNGNCE